MPDEIDNLLAQRAETCNRNGDFKYAASVSEGIKELLVNRAERADWMNYALDMMAGKLGRIEAGDPFHIDHWKDIAGYARLIVAELERMATPNGHDLLFPQVASDVVQSEFQREYIDDALQEALKNE